MKIAFAILLLFTLVTNEMVSITLFVQGDNILALEVSKEHQSEKEKEDLQEDEEKLNYFEGSSISKYKHCSNLDSRADLRSTFIALSNKLEIQSPPPEVS